MGRILLAWEYGGGLGPVRRLTALAGALRCAGHEPLFAFRDPLALAAPGPRCAAFPAPVVPRRAPPQAAPLNFSDLLIRLGWDDPDALAGALHAWSSLLALAHPALVVCDYAPAALLAAGAAGIPRLTVGCGFAQPPLRDPMPSLGPGPEPPAAALEAADARLLAALRASGAPGCAPERVSSLFRADADVVCTFEALDPWGTRPERDYAGPIDEDDEGLADLAWSSHEGRHVLAYLRPLDARFPALLAALSQLDAEVIVAAPGFQGPACATGTRLRVVAAPVRLDRLLARADLCVGHGGAGFVAHALLAGVPLALLPARLEHALVARRLAQAGCAVVAYAHDTPADLGAWLRAALGDRGLRARAGERSEALRGFSRDAAREAVAQRVAALARG